MNCKKKIDYINLEIIEKIGENKIGELKRKEKYENDSSYALLMDKYEEIKDKYFNNSKVNSVLNYFFSNKIGDNFSNDDFEHSLVNNFVCRLIDNGNFINLISVETNKHLNKLFKIMKELGGVVNMSRMERMEFKFERYFETYMSLIYDRKNEFLNQVFLKKGEDLLKENLIYIEEQFESIMNKLSLGVGEDFFSEDFNKISSKLYSYFKGYKFNFMICDIVKLIEDTVKKYANKEIDIKFAIKMISDIEKYISSQMKEAMNSMMNHFIMKIEDVIFNSVIIGEEFYLLQNIIKKRYGECFVD